MPPQHPHPEDRRSRGGSRADHGSVSHPGQRVLGRLRLSRSTEESTSIERQREIIEQWAQAHRHRIVGWAEDLDVSGSVRPFDTPGLGPWLGDRMGEWDILAAWKLDRLGRNAIQLSELFGWCQTNNRTLVSCSESIDLSTWAGRMLASVIAGLAEGELEAIRERTRSSRAKLRASARWPGGKPPYGYRSVRLDGGGWTLEIDSDAASVVRRIVSDLLDGVTLTGEARTLTSEGVHTPADYYRAKRGLEPLGGSWTTTPLRNLLRSPALLGRAHHHGQVVRDDEGQPVQLGEPLITLDEWEEVQAILDGNREARKDSRRSAGSLLTGLAFCLAPCQHKLAGLECPDGCPGSCESVLHHDLNSVRRPGRTYLYRYYRCKERDAPQLPAEELEELAEETFLRELGDREVRERVWVPGDDNEAAIREALRAVDELSKAAGNAASAAMRERLQGQLAALDRRLVELESTPVQEARWEYRPTGGTYRDAWRAADTEGRRELLSRSGITFAARVVGGRGSKAREFEIRIPPELGGVLAVNRDSL
jgi:site-specific DNA recombinase